MYPFLKKNFVSISPFNLNKIDSGVLWRINFVVSILSSHSSNLLQVESGSMEYALPGSKAIFGSSNKFLYLFDFRVLKVIFSYKKKYPDVILYCHTIWCFFYAIFFSICWIPFYFDDHNVEMDSFRSCNSFLTPFIYIMEFLLVHSASFVILSSTQDKHSLEKMYGNGLSKKLLVLENKFSPLKFSVNSKELLELYWLPDKKFFILFFGSFDYFPNQEGLIFIQNDLAQSFQGSFQYHFLIAWRCSQDNTMNNFGNMTYLWFVDNIDELILFSDLVIAPLFSGGGVKIKVLHALSLGKTVITTAEWASWMVNYDDQLIVASKGTFYSQMMSFLWK